MREYFTTVYAELLCDYKEYENYENWLRKLSISTSGEGFGSSPTAPVMQSATDRSIVAIAALNCGANQDPSHDPWVTRVSVPKVSK